KAVLECAQEDMERAVDIIVDISVNGRAPKQDPAIFALALIAGMKNGGAALDRLTEVCRTGTHLFQFVESIQNFRGWGRGLRNAVARWYLEKDPTELAYQLTKYRQRGGWTHRDV